MRRKQLIRDFTEGSIPRQLITFMLPFMAANAFQVLYTTVDMIIVGRYVGSSGLSAVSQGSQIINFATMFCSGFATAGQIVVAQIVGAKRYDELKGVIGTLFSMTLFMGALFAVAIVLLRNTLMIWLNIPEESVQMAISYITICGIAMVFSAGYNMIAAVLRGIGESNKPFVFILIASIVNIVFDLLFTGYMKMGVPGTAVATLMGHMSSFVLAAAYFVRHSEEIRFQFRLQNFIIQKKYFKVIGSTGIPLALRLAMVHISILFVNSMVNQLGVVASATFGVGMKIDDICNKTCVGIQHAATPIIGQNIAAKKPKRAKQTIYSAWIIASAITVIFVYLYVVFGRNLFMIFTDDPQVLALSPVFISAIIWTFIPLAIKRGTASFMNGIGKAKLGLLFAMINAVVLRIGLSWFFGSVLDLGFYGYVLGYGLAPFGESIPGLIYFLMGKWEKEKTLIDRI